MQELWAIEVNLDDNPMKTTSWHVDTLDNVIRHNLARAVHHHTEQNQTQRWSIVGVAINRAEASNFSYNAKKFISEQRLKNGYTQELEPIIDMLMVENWNK